MPDQFSIPSIETVRPRATVDGNSPQQPSKKGTRIHIGGPWKTDYPLSAVMLNWRGEKVRHEQTGDLNTGTFRKTQSDTSRHSRFPATPSHGSVGA